MQLGLQVLRMFNFWCIGSFDMVWLPFVSFCPAVHVLWHVAQVFLACDFWGRPLATTKAQRPATATHLEMRFTKAKPHELFLVPKRWRNNSRWIYEVNKLHETSQLKRFQKSISNKGLCSFASWTLRCGFASGDGFRRLWLSNVLGQR